MNFRQTIASITISCFLSLALHVPTASANVIGTQDYLSATTRAGQIASVQASLAREDVRAQLQKFGVDAADASARVASLTDEELTTVSNQLDTLPAGGDGVIVVLGIVFLVLLILELTGVIHIFRHV
ncbi:MAG: PA2779 family protein [Gammaproteobacteria bacterium]